MRRPSRLLLCVVAAVLALVLACGGDDDDGANATDSPASATGGDGITPTPADPEVPPLEGPGRGPAPTEFTDYREDPEWRLPEPDSLQPLPADQADEPFANPPAEPACRDDWAVIDRPTEGFKICHPDWTIAGHGYVGAANEERWYSLGIFDFVDESRSNQRAHVSVYVVPRFARPLRFTLDCPQPYAVTFAGEPAVVCPDFPGQPPEAEILSYHVFKNDHDYFVNVATYFTRDGDELTDEIDEESRDTAIEIAHTFQFTQFVGPGPALGTPQPAEDSPDAEQPSPSP